MKLNNSNILLLDNSFAAEPLFDALAKNHTVFTVGNLNLASLSLSNGERHLDVDYSIPQNFWDFCLQNNISNFLPGCTDVSLETYKLCNNNDDSKKFAEAVSITQNKSKFKALCNYLDIDTPKAYDKNNVKFPALFKPVDSYSGQGISIAHEFSELDFSSELAQSNSKTKEFLIEEYIDGPLYSGSYFFLEDNLIFKNFTREHCFSSPFTVDYSHVAFNFDKDIEKIISFQVRKLKSSFQISNIFMHFQFIIKNGAPHFLEMMLRCPGDLYSKLVELSVGINYSCLYANCFNYFLGDLDTKHYQNETAILRITLTISPQTYIKSFKFPNLDIVHFVPTVPIGTVNLSNKPMRVALIFIRYSEIPKQFPPKDLFLDASPFVI